MPDAGKGNNGEQTERKQSQCPLSLDELAPDTGKKQAKGQKHKKENVQAELKDGYLTITASNNTEKEEKDENGKFIRRERYYGNCTRSFYVGDVVEQEDIKARFENGVLVIDIPKKEAKPKIEEKKFIAIE